MLNLANVKVTIAPDGSTKFDFSGFEGATCLTEAEALKTLLAQYGIRDQTLGCWLCATFGDEAKRIANSYMS